MRKLPFRCMTVLAILLSACATAAAQTAAPRTAFKEFIDEPAFKFVKLPGNALDIATSFFFDGRRIREGNPLFANSDGTCACMRNIAFTVLYTWAEYEVWKRDRKFGVALLIIDGLMRGIVGARNAWLLSGTRSPPPSRFALRVSF